MTDGRRSGRRGVGVAVACVASLITWAAAAQNIDPSQMMSIFNGLSSEQQQALIQQLGGAAGGGASAGASSAGGLGGLGGGSSLLRQLAPGASGSNNSTDLSRLRRRES